MDITDKRIEQLFINQEKFVTHVDELTAYLKDFNEKLDKFLDLLALDLLARTKKIGDEMDDEMDDEIDDESN